MRKVLPMLEYAEAKELALYFAAKVTEDKVGQYVCGTVSPLKETVLTMELMWLLGEMFAAALKPKCDVIYTELHETATKLQRDFVSEEDVHAVLLSKDLEGRTVVSILIDLDAISIVSINHLKTLANSIWNGDYCTESSALITATSSLWSLLKRRSWDACDEEATQRWGRLSGKRSKRQPGEERQLAVWKVGMAFRCFLLCLEHCVWMMLIFLCGMIGREAMKTATTNDILFNLDDPVKLAVYNDNLYIMLQFLILYDYLVILLGFMMLRSVFKCLYKVLSQRRFAVIDGDTYISLTIFLVVLLHCSANVPILGPQDAGLEKNVATSKRVINYIKNTKNNLCLGVTLFLLSIRFLYSLKITELVGPFIHMIEGMLQSLLLFGLFFVLLLVIFCFAGSIMLPWSIPEVQDYSTFLATLFQASTGVFDLNSQDYGLYGILFYVIFIVTFNILLLNLIVAILNKIYSDVTDKSQLLYLQNIISLREQYLPHDHLQFLNWTFGPLPAFFLSRLYLHVSPFELERQCRKLYCSGHHILPHGLGIVVALKGW